MGEDSGDGGGAVKKYKVGNTEHAKQVVAKYYSFNELGEEMLPLLDELFSNIGIARETYVSKMTELAKKYNIPEEKLNGFMSFMLHPMAAELFGFSDSISQEFKYLEEQNKSKQERLDRVEKNLRDLLK